MSAKPQKMCKSPPKSSSAKGLPELGYEGLSTTCTLVGSNNLTLDSKGYVGPHAKLCAKPMKSPDALLKKPDFVAKFGGFAPVQAGGRVKGNGGYSLPSPGPNYPSAAGSPYSVQIASPANSVSSIKSPVPSPQSIRPPTPQPILPQAFQQLPTLSQNLVQIIHAAPQNTTPTAYANHQVLAQRTILAPQTSQQQQLLKIKPPQNILPKPPGALGGGGGGGKGAVGGRASTPVQAPPGAGVGQLVLPGQVPGPALLLNQMPLLGMGAAGGVQLILRPGTPTPPTKLGPVAAGGPQVILQQPPQPQGRPGAQPHNQHLHQPQQLVRVLTANGMLQSLNPLGGLNALGPTYIMQQPQVQSLQQQAPPVQSLQQQQAPSKPPTFQPALTGGVPHGGLGPGAGLDQLPPPKRKPKKKKKNKEPKLDLANIMKLSGIGDEDDVLFESDASESALPTDLPTHTSVPTSLSTSTITQQQKLPKPLDSPHHPNEMPTITQDYPKRIGNIHISALHDIKHTRTDSVLTDKQTFGQSQLSVQQSLSDINAINQNLAQIGLMNQNFITGSSQILSQHTSGENLANILQALNQGHNLQNFSLLNGAGLQNITSVAQPTMTSFTSNTGLPTSSYQKFPTPNFSMAQTLNSDTILTGLSKPQPTVSYSQPTQKQPTSATNPITHFNIPSAIPNIQVQNFCGNNSNLILNQLNQGANILAPNIPNFSGNITINNSLIPNANLTLPNNLMTNFLPANLVQPTQDLNAGFGNNVQRTGGFKLALSEDGRLILQHDPTLNQDIQSQLLLQSIFGINLQGGNLVLTSVNNTPSLPPPPKPVTMSEPLKKPQQLEQPSLTTTKTTSINHHSIPSVKTEPPPLPQPQPLPPPPPQHHPEPQTAINNHPPPPNNYSYIVNLTPEQLETLKRNGQLTVNGQTIFMHRPNVANKDDKNVIKSPKGKTPKKNQKIENKNAKTVLQEHLNIKNQNMENHLHNTVSNHINKISTSSMTNQTIINSLQNPVAKNLLQPNNQIIISGCTTEPKQTTIDSIYTPNSQKNHHKINDNQQQVLMSQKQTMMKQTPSGEQLIILQQQSIGHKQNMHGPIKSEPEMIFTNSSAQNIPDNTTISKQMQFINGIESSSLNVEQFLSNLNINPTNLGQLISQKLSQELPSGIDPKIVNISPGPTAGHIVAKIDISPDNMQQILNSNSSGGGMEKPPASVGGNTDVGNLVLPPLISMGVKQEAADVFNSGNGQMSSDPPPTQIQPQIQLPSSLPLPLPPPSPQLHIQPPLPPQPIPPPPPPVQPPPQVIPTPQVQTQPQLPQQQLPALIIGGTVPVGAAETQLPPQSVPTPVPVTVPPAETSGGKVYQRVQTIQLTPQKQQLLKSVQLQIHALSARLQQKDGSNTSDQQEIHTALRHLFLEQQKILATGKVIPNITQPLANITSNNNNNHNNTVNSTCSMETLATQAVPVTTASKTNGTFLTSILQQPVVSHNQTQKVYYHHGNQIIAINPQLPSTFPPLPTSTTGTAPTTITLTPTSTTSSSCQTVGPALPVAKKKPPPPLQLTVAPALVVKQQLTGEGEVHPVKEVQSEGAKVGPAGILSPRKGIVKPSYSKAQLIEQQLQTDQNGAMNPDITTPFSSKADAVKRLVRYHCYKQPVLSQKDLAKADEIFELTARHFIDKFRCMVTKYQALLLKESMREVQTSELMMIDRMFLAEEQQAFLKLQSDLQLQSELELAEGPSIKTEEEDRASNNSNADFNIKCGLNYFSDESCDSNNFQPEFSDFIGLSSEKPQEKTKNNMESYNTTKIIGNFEIEINNQHRQKMEKSENFTQKEEDYDEWLCIQRELGYFPENKSSEGPSEGPSERGATDSSEPRIGANKRVATERSGLESLKKYRVEKHNSKVKKTGSIIGEVKFEVRIEHKKVQVKTEPSNEKQSLKRSQYVDASDIYAKRAKQTPATPSYIKQEQDGDDEEEPISGGETSSDGREPCDRSIDEQVQSAIDSILNLQQIASMADRSDGQEAAKAVLCRKNDDLGFPGSNPEDTLDEAVNSILS